MKNNNAVKLGAVCSVFLVAFATGGCATKKHVRGVVAPVENRVGQVEKKQQEHTAAIGELESGVTRADERAMEADKKAQAAGQNADKANQAASEAGQRADQARAAADKSMERVGSVERQLGNLDNYQQVADTSILFRFDRADLDDDAKAKLDEMAKKVMDMKSVVIEIEGYTDRTGGARYNLELSRRRADAVVRYLTTQHDVPLRRIHVLGIGEDKAVADNKSRDGRKQNRRVEIKVFSLDLGTARVESSSATTPSQP